MNKPNGVAMKVDEHTVYRTPLGRLARWDKGVGLATDHEPRVLHFLYVDGRRSGPFTDGFALRAENVHILQPAR